MIKIAKYEINTQDDIIWNNFAFSLYAIGCKWNCEGCHSKELQSFNYPQFNLIGINLIDEIKRYHELYDITVVGVGGDFYFQLQEWKQFTTEIKSKVDCKILWYTGSEYNQDIVKDFLHVDGILWGALKNTNNKVYKYLSLSNNNHKSTQKILVGDFIGQKINYRKEPAYV